MIRGTLQFTPDELAEIVAAALGQNGYDCNGLSLYDSAGNLVSFDRAVATLAVGDLVVRSTPENGDDIAKHLYPLDQLDTGDAGQRTA